TKTWLTPSDKASPAGLSYGGLQFTHALHPGNKHGGVCLMSDSCIFTPIVHLPSPIFSSFEVHTVHLYSFQSPSSHLLLTHRLCYSFPLH
ncbi:hypothetical protein PRIEUP_LOCUS437, partial [Pristimantis euphronides]